MEGQMKVRRAGGGGNWAKRRENNKRQRFTNGKGCDYILQGEQRGRERLRTL